MQTDAVILQPEDVEALLRAGIAAAKSGQRERARELLTRVVEQDEKNALAWLWLSGAVDSPEEREVCLENVLTLDPDNVAARKGLALVRKQKMDQPLREGIAAAKSGQRERARELLTRVVEQDEENASAWLWLSGVVDNLEDREVCLENVLALDPDNDRARKELALVRKEKDKETQVAAEVVTPFFGPDLAPPASLALDEFDNEYLCPYCAASTKPKDRRCRACGGKLWGSFRKREKRSAAMWVAMALQALNTIQTAIIPLILSLVVFGAASGELSAWMRMYAELSGVSSATIRTWAGIAFLVTLLPFLFSLTVLIGLCVRWKPVFYLLLIDAALGLALAVVSIVVSFPSDMAPFLGGSYICTGVVVFAALARLFLAFQIEDDFALEKQRILLRLDSGITSVPMILARGHEYAKLKMWALAALHMRRAVAMVPDRLEGRAALTLTYLKLKRYDLAAYALEEARRISPGDPRIAELQTLLDHKRSADSSP